MRIGLLRAVSRVAILACVGSFAAACSTDAVRLSQSPFSSTFNTPEPSRTGSIDGSAPSAPPSAPVAPVATAPVPAPAARDRGPVTATASAGAPGWSAAGGTTIIVAPGETLTAISDRYGVPASAILATNGITAAQVVAGRKLVIPVYSATGGPQPARTVEAPAPKPGAKGRVAASAAQPKGKPAPKSLADAKRARPEQEKASAKAAEKPEPKSAKLAGKAQSPAQGAKPEPKSAAKSAASGKPAEAPKAVAAAPAPKPAPAPREPESTGAVSAAAGPGFRWPARGRVISGFGQGNNEGINIAVPDGTPVKAAGDGVVAYAGSEVKGYGNLVLIRHDNGYVSAYAHNSDIDVKRGQRVARGQTIAKAGQTGNVTSPQLHFEIRKGSTPVDPMRHLASAN